VRKAILLIKSKSVRRVQHAAHVGKEIHSFGRKTRRNETLRRLSIDGRTI
jgi:hypothetical protein